MGKVSKKIPADLRQQLYESSVQNVSADVTFINEQYKRIFKKAPVTLREDFGGTGALACEWVKNGHVRKAIAIDLDPAPIEYGKKVHFGPLKDDQKERVIYLEDNVLSDFDFKSDITVAFNFSYFIFKKRKDLLEYFEKVYAGLKDEGVFFVDIFGGTECRQELVEETDFDDHTYYWDCERYNPLTNEVLYYIHFRTHKDNVKYEQAFVYDWRMWTVAEIVELMEEAGFDKVETFWEEDDDDGTGSGEFYLSKDEENCESWVTYIAGTKKS